MPTKLAATEHIDECQVHTAKLLAALKAKHGGEWVVDNDEMHEFVVIRRSG